MAGGQYRWLGDSWQQEGDSGLSSAVPSFVSSALESSYHKAPLSLTFPGKLQLGKGSGEGAGVCVKTKQREQSLILLPKSPFFFFSC